MTRTGCTESQKSQKAQKTPENTKSGRAHVCVARHSKVLSSYSPIFSQFNTRFKRGLNEIRTLSKKKKKKEENVGFFSVNSSFFLAQKKRNHRENLPFYLIRYGSSRDSSSPYETKNLI